MDTPMKEKLVTISNTEKLQILTLVLDSWSQKYCSEYFGVSEYLIRSARELKQRKGILAQPSQKKGKALAQETIDLVHAFHEDGEYSRQLSGKKDYASIQKGIHKQKRLVLCSLHELFDVFKERNPDLKIGFSKFVLSTLSHYRFIRNTLGMCLYYLSKHHFVSRHSKLGSYIQRSCQESSV